jgi:DNA-binding MarR family transcriptional regulator
MENIVRALESYLQEVLGLKVKAYPWKGQNKLPFFLVDSYNFYEISLLKRSCLLMVAKEGTEVTPALVRKLWEEVLKKWDGLCIFVQSAISTYNRKRLIEHRIPFVIPGTQIFLPDLGIELREHFRTLRAPKKFFSPATQALVIFALHQTTYESLIPSEMTKELGYTQMTLSRAFDELEDAGIGTINRKGRERLWIFNGSKRELWEQTKPMLRSPVKLRVWIKDKKPKIFAGLSALAHFTMLNPPSLPVYATSWEEWKKSGRQELPSPEGATFELEVWYYDPFLFANKNMVDLFSLYLSLEANMDERIESALEELMRKIKW